MRSARHGSSLVVPAAVLAALAAGAGPLAPGLSAATLPPVAPAMACADLKGVDLSRGEVPVRLDSAEEAMVGTRRVCVIKG